MSFLYKSWQCFPTLKNNLMEKIRESRADIFHFDLEDSIPELKKQEAREILKNLLSNNFFSKPIALRINSLVSEHGLDDLNFIKKNAFNIDILILPKVESWREIEIVHHCLKNKPLKIFAVIETLKGLKNIESICHSNSFLSGIIFGAADMSSEIGHGIHWSRRTLDFIRYDIAKTALSHHLMVIDSPCFEIKNLAKLEEESYFAKELGFSGKIAIHPDQIDSINHIFNYSDTDLETANIILQAINDEKAITELNGKMIGPPFVKMAKKLIQVKQHE